MRRKVVLRDSAESTLSFYVFVYACTWGGKDFPEVSKRKDDNALTDERIKELEPTSGRERRVAVCTTNTAAGFRKAAGAAGTMIIGFFFGGTDIDEYYYEDLEETVKIVEECEKYPEDEFTYHSSW